MAIRDEFAKSQPLKGARITGSLHMTIQTAVLIETLQALGADVRWASCNIFSTQDHAAAAIAAKGTPVFAVKGETLADYWDYTHRIFDFGPKGSEGEGPNMILDDGGDATLLMHLGQKAAKDAFADRQPDQRRRALPVRRDQGQAGRRPDLVRAQGEAHHRRDRRDHDRRASPERDERRKARCCSAPSTSMISVTKSKFDNLYGCRESLVDGIKRATDVMVAGKVAVVAATATWARVRHRHCARYRRRCGSPRLTRSTRCRPAWKAIAW